MPATSVSPVARRVLRNDRRQLAMVAVGFVLAIALLESRGLVVWADRLEVGPLQQRLAQAARGLDRRVAPLGIGAWRPQALHGLARLGWSDLPPEASATQTAASPVASMPIDAATPAASMAVPSTPPAAPLPPPATPAPSIAAPAPPTAPAAVATPTSIPPSPSEPAPTLPPVSPLPPGLPLPPISPLPAVQASSAAATLTPLPQASAARPRVVALAGDSVMAVGLAAQLQRDLAPYRDSIVTLKAYRSATGLARPEVFDWHREYPLMLEQRKPDVVIVAIGANDGQGFVDDGKVKAFGSPEWQAVYTRRVEEYLAMLARDGAVVLWLQLPPMKAAKFNARMEAINEIARAAVARQPRAIWWNPMARIADADGQFREFGLRADGQKTVRLREADGIHLSDEGAGLITPDLVRWLHPAAPAAPAVRTGP